MYCTFNTFIPFLHCHKLLSFLPALFFFLVLWAVASTSLLSSLSLLFPLLSLAFLLYCTLTFSHHRLTLSPFYTEIHTSSTSTAEIMLTLEFPFIYPTASSRSVDTTSLPNCFNISFFYLLWTIYTFL